ncbi:MAG TPA: STAS domain-containing protein [Acidimicrobiales bacterium]
MSPELEQPLTINVHREGAEATLTLQGELDPHTAPMLADEIDGSVHDGATTVVLVLTGLGFVDSAGLRVIISADRALSEQGGRLVLRAPSDNVRRLLEITGLLDHLHTD